MAVFKFSRIFSALFVLTLFLNFKALKIKILWQKHHLRLTLADWWTWIEVAVVLANDRFGSFQLKSATAGVCDLFTYFIRGSIWFGGTESRPGWLTAYHN